MSVINVWKHKRRICNLILGLKGLNVGHVSFEPTVYWSRCKKENFLRERGKLKIRGFHGFQDYRKPCRPKYLANDKGIQN